MAVTVVEALQKVLESHRNRTSPVRTALVVGRNTDGTAQLRREDGECISRGLTPAYIGQRIRSTENGFSDAGASGISLNTRNGSRPLLWIEALDPHDIPTGETTTVTVTGYGFTETTVVDFLLPGTDDIHPDITQVEQRFIDENSLEIDVLVAAAAELFDDYDISYDDVARPF